MKQTRRTNGFTIIELLIVIIVIGILATLILVGYNNISKQAAVTRIKNDAEQSYKQLDLFNVRNNRLPADQTEARSVVALSDGTTLEYTLTSSTSYCVTTSSTSAQTNYYFDSSTRSVQQGKCTGHIGYSSGSYVTSTFAGSASGVTGTTGYSDGPAASALFNGPTAMIMDSSGNMFVGDNSNYKIRKISGGVVSTFAGSTIGNTDAVGTAAKFNLPNAFAIDASNNLWVADAGGCVIRKVTPSAAVTTIAGTYNVCGAADGNGTAATFNYPSSIVIDPTNTFFYILDALNNEIRKMTMSGTVTTFVGQPSSGTADGTGTAAQFNNPKSIAIDLSGNLWVSDLSNNEIRKVTPAGVVTTVAGSTTSGSADGTGSAASFYFPYGIAVDPTSGNIYINDQRNHRIRKMTPGGVVTTFMGSSAGYVDGSAAVAKFNFPGAMFIDSSGTMYITDGGGSRIRKIALQ